jgi:hypothetical protein
LDWVAEADFSDDFNLVTLSKHPFQLQIEEEEEIPELT